MRTTADSEDNCAADDDQSHGLPPLRASNASALNNFRVTPRIAASPCSVFRRSLPISPRPVERIWKDSERVLVAAGASQERISTRPATEVSPYHGHAPKLTRATGMPTTIAVS